MNQEEMFEKTFDRPSNYFLLSLEKRREIDSNLGILNWLPNRFDLSNEQFSKYQDHYLLSYEEFTKLLITPCYENKTNKKIQEIKWKIEALKPSAEEEKNLLYELQEIRSSCTHPEITVFKCPDCGYKCLDDKIFDFPYCDRIIDALDLKVEETRIRNRKLKAKYSREEIKKQINEIKKNIQLIGVEHYPAINKFQLEIEQIQLDCKHLYISEYGSCSECRFSVLRFE